jgi:hypothetical protein
MADQTNDPVSGGYKFDPKTGISTPDVAQPQPTPIGAYANGLNNTVNSLMKGYLRKDNTGGYMPLTSEAPQSALQPFTAMDKYRTFGVPFTGIPYGSQGQQNNSYGAMFSSPSGSGY